MDFRRAYDPARALSSAWKILWRAPLTMLLGGILLFVTGGGGGGSGSWKGDGSHFGGMETAAIVAIAGLVCCLGLGLFVFNCLLRIGFGAAVQRVMVTGKDQIGDLFRPRGLLLSMVVANVLVALIMVLALIPFGLVIGGGFLLAEGAAWHPLLVVAVVALSLAWLVVWIWILLGLTLVPEAIAIEGLGPVDALERSWSLTRGNRLELFLYSLVMFLAQLLGCAVCCIGLLVTGPWTYVAWYESYVRLTQPAPAEGFWMDRGTAGGSSR